MSSPRAASPLLLISLLLAGCAHSAIGTKPSDLDKSVNERTGQSIHWNIPAPDSAGATLQGEISADRAVQIAFENNRDLQATLAELGIARADLRQASMLRNPVFDGEIRFPGGPARPFELSVTQTLLDLIQLPVRRRQGAAAFAATSTRVEAALVNFASEVRTGYYDLQASEQILARQSTITEAARSSAELAVRQHDAGNISDLDLENEQALYETAKLQLARAQLNALMARERLIVDLGIPKNDPAWTVPSQFPAIPNAESETGDIENMALSRRVDIAVARAELDAARSALPIARSAVLQDVSAGIHHDRDADGSTTTGPGISIPIPLFNRGGVARERAQAAVRMNEQRLAALMTEVRSEVRSAHEQLVEARSRAEYLRDVVVPRRQRIVALTLLEYNSMHRGVFELIQSRQNLAEAERELIVAQRDYWVAGSEMDRAINGGGRFSVRD